MTALLSPATTGILQDLTWSLLHQLWEGAAIALVLAIVLSVAHSPRARYGAACATLALMIVGFVVTFAVTASRDRSPVYPAPRLPARLASSAADAGGNSPTPVANQGPEIWIVPLWLTGVMAFYIRATGGWLAARRWRRDETSTVNPIWLQSLSRLKALLGISKPVLLLQSGIAEVPVVIGYLRPVILFPAGMLAGMPPEHVEYILLHELAHIRRHDYLINLFQTFAEGLFFYHPAVWWISRTICTERENCCDDIAAGQGNPHEYASALATLEGYRQGIGQPAMAATGGNLMNRIRRLLLQPERARAPFAPIFSALLVLGFAGISIAHQTKPAERKPIAVPATQARAAKPEVIELAQAAARPTIVPHPLDAPAADVNTAFKRWLTEDVAYIITDQERAAFKALASDQEREKFVEQFWLRRDPTPGTDENEYKIEHYRRIAFTNEHFSDNSLPGWKTDRGRIYTTYGPPDEIDSHPSGGSYNRPESQGGGTINALPFEQWTYRYIEGIGMNVIIEFVADEPGGRFRMTMDPHEKERPAK